MASDTNSGCRKTTRGDVIYTNSILFNETPSQSVPGTGKGRLWVRNDMPNVLIFTNEAGIDLYLGSLSVREEGSNLGQFTALNFVGGTVTATNAGGGVCNVTVTPTSFREEGVAVTGGPHTALNFIGSTVTAADGGGGVCNVTVTPTSFREEGVAVTGGPHTALNFIGSTVTAADGGGGVCNVTVASAASNLTSVLTAGNDAGNLSITNLNTATINTSITLAGKNLVPGFIGGYRAFGTQPSGEMELLSRRQTVGGSPGNWPSTRIQYNSTVVDEYILRLTSGIPAVISITAAGIKFLKPALIFVSAHSTASYFTGTTITNRLEIRHRNSGGTLIYSQDVWGTIGTDILGGGAEEYTAISYSNIFAVNTDDTMQMGLSTGVAQRGCSVSIAIIRDGTGVTVTTDTFP